MSSRDLIFNALKNNKPELVELPHIDIDKVISFEDLAQQFAATLTKIGGQVINLPNMDAVKEAFANELAEDEYIINVLDSTHIERQELLNLTSYELASVDKVFIKGTLGIAENGSIWVDENQMGNRLLPFISQHLIIVLNKRDIVATMHQAYQKINVAETGFGTFIAGPSKTADIEQCLVIGAHGARSLKVFLVG